MSNLRIKSLDSGRAIAIFSVILLHAHPFEYSYQVYGNPFFHFLHEVVQSIRFGVPFFFMTSGYLFGGKLLQSENLWPLCRRYVGRLIFLFAGWSFVYLLTDADFITSSLTHDPVRALYWYVQTHHPSLLDFLLTGGKYHLWFFPALILALLLLACFIHFRLQAFMLVLGGLLYLVSLLGKAYSTTPIGFHTGVFDMRSGPFVSMLFVSLGWWVSQQRNLITRNALALVVIGIVLRITEGWILHDRYGVSYGEQYLIGTVPLSLGLFILFLKHPDFGARTWLPKIGLMTLGVYAVHVFVLDNLKGFHGYFPALLWDLSFPLVVYGISVLITMIWKKIPFIKGMAG